VNEREIREALRMTSQRIDAARQAELSGEDAGAMPSCRALWPLILGAGLSTWVGACSDAVPLYGDLGGTTTTTTSSCASSNDCPSYSHQGSGQFCDGDSLYVAAFACEQGCCSCERFSQGTCEVAACIDEQDGNAHCEGSGGGGGGAPGGAGGAGPGGAGGQGG
jgi:hypothetical protein